MDPLRILSYIALIIRGREETRGGKGLKMKTIEKRGSICPKRISAGPKGIVAIKASMGGRGI